MSARLPQHLIRLRNRSGLLLVIFVLNTGLLASACGSSSSNDVEQSLDDSPSSSELEVQVPGGSIGVFDGNWVLTEADIAGAPEVEGRPLKELVILFEVDDPTSTLVVHTNCHERSGSYTFNTDHSASISLPGSTTQTCDDIATAFEDLAVQLLESVTGWERDDDQLTLFADPELDSISSSASSPPENPFPATLVFHLVD